MLSFRDLRLLQKKNSDTNLPTIKVAIVGDSATQFLAIALKGCAIEKGYALDLYEADYAQIELQMLNPQSELHLFAPEFIIVFHSSQKLLEKYWRMDTNHKSSLADDRIGLVDQFCESTHAQIIYFNYPLIDDGVFGSYSSNVYHSFPCQLRLLNTKLIECCQRHKNLHICDLDSLQQINGRKWLFDSSIYTNSEMVLSIDALPYVASRCMDVIMSLKGKIKKCIILDLDNTLWGGIIGDDGLDKIQLGHGLGIGKCFTNLQLWIRQLELRGIIVCVCSKNDETIARLPFEKHPDMILKLDDIAVFIANWDNKADNIRHIQEILNIGFDSMVFIDDNPFERNLVRENVPEVTVPELPEDPSDYLEYLMSLNLFETASYNESDEKRNEQYRIEAQRTSYARSFTDETHFLQNLGMISKVENLTQYNIPRVSQLSQRSNQFNLRTVRYSESDLLHISQDDSYKGMVFYLKDKFGDNGLIAAVILHQEGIDTFFVENFFMSCRVLKRGMEYFILNEIVCQVRELGCGKLVGEYIPTQKNKLVENLFNELGFIQLTDAQQLLYELPIDGYENRITYVQKSM